LRFCCQCAPDTASSEHATTTSLTLPAGTTKRSKKHGNARCEWRSGTYAPRHAAYASTTRVLPNTRLLSHISDIFLAGADTLFHNQPDIV
jgi:hypothetical protein